MNDKTETIDGGGVLFGSDGKLSLRRLMGIFNMAVGTVLFFIAMFMMPEIIKLAMDKANISAWHIILPLLLFIPGVTMILVSLFILKQITAQNIAAIAKTFNKDKEKDK